ncbi:hypothetical protein ACMAY5_12710 [Arenicellales bacterium nBUS_48]
MLTSKLGLKILSNALSLIGAIIFLVMFFELKDPNFFRFNDWGDQWSSSYYQKHVTKFRELIKPLQKGETDSAILQLENDWSDLEKRDRAYRLKWKLLLALSEELHRQKRYDELLKWSSEWRAQDDRDIDAIAFYYEALYRSKDNESEGFNGLKTEWHRFPESSTLAGFYSMALKERGIHDPTFEPKRYKLHQKVIEQQQQNVLKSARQWKVRFYSDIPTAPVTDREYEDYVDLHNNLKETWALISDYLKGKPLGQYSAKHGLTPSQQAEYWVKKGAKTKTLFGRLHFAANPQTTLISKPLGLNLVTKTNNWSRLTLKLGPDIETLRIDLPPKIKLQIDKVRIRTTTSVHSIPLSQIKSQNMELVSGSLTSTSGTNRYFFIPVNDYLPHIENEQDLSIELVIQVSTKVGTIALAEFSTGLEN